MKPKLDTSKSPTRKQLVKKIINYTEQLKEWHEFDVKWHGRASSNRRSSRKNTRSPKTGSGQVKIEEAYDDEDHRKMKMEKLKELMKVERDMAEYDGELNFKKQDIDKSYAGYPMFMQRRESPRTSRERLGSNDSISNLKRPLLEELKDSIIDAEKIVPGEHTEIPLEESKLDLCNSSCHQYVCKHRKEGEPIRIQSKDGSVVFEEKLYYLEIEHQTDYNESPLKERFDFHQRKSKEIRRLQYMSTLNARRKTPSPTSFRKPLVEPVREIVFRQAPKMEPQLITKEISPRRERVYDAVARREPSFEYREGAEISLDNSKELTQDRNYYTTLRNLGVFNGRPTSSNPDILHNDGIKSTIIDPNLFAQLKPNKEDEEDSAMRHSGEPDDISEPGSPESEEIIEPNKEDSLDRPVNFLSVPFEMSREPSAYFEPLFVAQRSGAASMQSSTHSCYARKVYLRPRNLPGSLTIKKTLERAYIIKPRTSVRVEPSPEKYTKNEETSYIHKVYLKPRIDPSPERYHKVEDKAYVQKVHQRPRIDPSPDRYLKVEDKTYVQKVHTRPRIEPSPSRFHKVEDKAYVKRVYERPRIDPSPERYIKAEDSAYIQKVHTKPRLEGSPERYMKAEDKTYVKKVYEKARIDASPDKYNQSQDKIYINKIYDRPRIEPSPEKYTKAEDKVYIEKVYLRPRIEPSPEKYQQKEEKSPYFNRVYEKPRIEPSPDRYHQSQDKSYIKKVYERPRIEPSPDRYHQSQDKSYIKKVYEKPRIDPSPERFHKVEDKSYIQKVYERPRIEPSPDRYHQSQDKSYIKKVYEKPRIEASPDKYYQTEDKSYIKKVYERPRIDPSPEKYQQAVDKSYIERVYERTRIEPSPEKYHQKEDKTYIKKVYERPRIESSPDKYHQAEDKSYIKKVYERPRIEPSPERYQKAEDKSYIKKVYTRPRIEPSPEKYYQTEDKSYIKKVYTRPRIDPSPERYQKAEDKAYIQKVYTRPRIDPSPERYQKTEDKSYIQKVYNRPRIEASSNKIILTLDQAYIKKVYQRVRCDPSPKTEAREDSGYFKKIHERARVTPSPDKYYQTLEGGYFNRVYDKPRIQASPEKYIKTEEEVYIDKVYRRARTPGAVRAECGLESTYVKKLYLRKRINPLIIFCKLEKYYMRQTLLWESVGENLSVGSADEVSVGEISKYSSGRSARDSYSSNGDNVDYGLNKDDHPSDDDSLPVIDKPTTLVQPSLEDQESHEGSETEISVREESEEDVPEGMIRTKPDETFPVYVLAEDGYHIPARISSKEGFLIDMAKGKLEIRTGDLVTVYMADSKILSPTSYLDQLKPNDDPPTKEGSKDDDISVQSPRRAFETTEDTVKKPDMSRDPDCDFIVTGKDRLPVVVVPRYIGPKVTNSTLYDPEDKKIDRAWFTLLPRENEPWGFGIWASEGTVREVMARNATTDAIEIKRAPGAVEFEEVNGVSRQMIGDVPVLVYSLGGRRGGRLYIPEKPAQVLRSRLLDGEDGLTHPESGPIPEGTVLIEATPAGDLEIYLLVPPEKRSTVFGEVPRYVLVDLDGQTDEDQRAYNELKDRVRLLEEARDASPKRQSNFSPNKKQITIDQVDLKLVSPHGHEVRVDIKDIGMQPDEMVESELDQYRSVHDPEDLYYQVECDNRQLSGPGSTPKGKESINIEPKDALKDVYSQQDKKINQKNPGKSNVMDLWASKNSQQSQPANSSGYRTAGKDSHSKPIPQGKQSAVSTKPGIAKKDLGKDSQKDKSARQHAKEQVPSAKEAMNKAVEPQRKGGYLTKHIGRSERTTPAPKSKPLGYKQPLRGADIFDELITPRDYSFTDTHSSDAGPKGIAVRRPVNGPAKIRIDMGGQDDNNRVQFVGVGIFSSGKEDRSRSPRRYTDQLKELNERAARTVQLYWQYTQRKTKIRDRFRKKFGRARETLGNDRLFRKFLLHFVSLPGREDVDKALANYVKVLNRSSTKDSHRY